MMINAAEPFCGAGCRFWDYEPKYFWWEMLVFTRKLLMLTFSIWFPPVTSFATRALSLSFIVVTSTVRACSE